MFGTRVLFTLLSTAVAVATAATDFSKLPVFFFHGVRGNHSSGDNYVAKLSAEGRTVVPLSFCESTCSLEAIVLQVPKAIAQVREVVSNSSEFDDGYIFIGHSQGGAVSRAVIEEMDDHKVKRYISTAGLQNGQFIGPDKVEVSIKNDAPFLAALVPETMFNYSAYGPEDFYGKMQKDYVLYSIENPDAQYTYSQFNVNRWPQFGSFSTANFFLPVYNNVDTIEEIETKFMNLTIVNMNETLEYTSDTFGLKTLDERGGLFLHEVANVSHSCWRGDDGDCKWEPLYNDHLYAVLH
ncbi:hypothetical protein PPTG_00760 [Phytophthora nicotianae INRA-310]|uniref:Lysosomal thioesterase PPT2 n=1 Tax=Phytophthora nicotianae (strain INRA-310) TaxID=761204 RepID=W2RIF2_PHYN3|nr:hypothetical protein PPTG_00760 [Phytophthora nicotianae INRA-310]ETN24434.1 hypothetical protein PPTG_00760 [Phytophthora nicotianae INRA-310]